MKILHFADLHLGVESYGRIDPTTGLSSRFHVFSPQFLPIYVNPTNDKIQAYYHHEPEYRTREEFLYKLRRKSKSIVLE